MPHTKKANSTLQKGARALKSSTPKRPATSPTPAQVNLKTLREIRLTFRPNLPLHHLKAGHLPRISLRIASQSEQLPRRPWFRKLQQYTSLKPQRPPPLLNKKPACTVLLPPHCQTVLHLVTLPKPPPPHHKPQFFPILAPHLGLHFPLHLALLSRLKTPVLILFIFILTSNIGKVRQKF